MFSKAIIIRQKYTCLGAPSAPTHRTASRPSGHLRRGMPFRAILGPLPTFAAAKVALKQWNDNGLMGHPLWRTAPGGGSERRYFQCHAHVQCPVKALITKEKDSFYVKRNTATHAIVPQNKKRKNSPLTMDQEEEAKLAFSKYGATPLLVCFHHCFQHVARVVSAFLIA